MRFVRSSLVASLCAALAFACGTTPANGDAPAGSPDAAVDTDPASTDDDRPDAADAEPADLPDEAVATDPAEAGDGTAGDEMPGDAVDAGDTVDAADPADSSDSLDAQDAPADVSPPPLYRTDGRFIRDRDGRAILLRGINVASGDLENWSRDTPGADAAVFADVAASGFDAVRLVINWDRIEPQPDRFDEAYLALVDGHVRLAAAQGLYVVIDMHQDLYGIGFGNHGAPAWSCDSANYDAFHPIDPWFLNYFSAPVEACFDHLWKDPATRHHQQESARRVAERIADVDLVLGFDPVNEPAPGSTPFDDFDRDLLMPFYVEFAAVVAPSLPGRLFFFEPTPSFSALGSTAMPGPVTAFAGVFAPHYYNPTVEQNRLWDGDAEAVAQAVKVAADAADALGVPWAYGEMGGAMETPNLTDYLVALFSQLDLRMAGSFPWIYSKGSQGFGMIDATTGTWNSHASAFLRPAPVAVAGTPTAFAWDLGTLRLSLDWIDDGVHATEVLLPAWVRAAGYDCQVDGVTTTVPANAAGNRLLLPAGPPGPRTFRMQVRGPYPR